MSSLAENIEKVVAANSAIKDALANKGVDVSDYQRLSQAAEKINSIQTGSTGLPATKNETTGEYEVDEATTFKKTVTVEVEDSDESTESDTGIGICAFDSTTERGVEVFDASSNKSSALVPDGTRFVTMGTIKEAAYQFPTFSNDDTIKTIIAKLQQIITLLQGIGD